MSRHNRYTYQGQEYTVQDVKQEKSFNRLLLGEPNSGSVICISERRYDGKSKFNEGYQEKKANERLSRAHSKAKTAKIRE